MYLLLIRKREAHGGSITGRKKCSFIFSAQQAGKSRQHVDLIMFFLRLSNLFGWEERGRSLQICMRNFGTIERALNLGGKVQTDLPLPLPLLWERRRPKPRTALLERWQRAPINQLQAPTSPLIHGDAILHSPTREKEVSCIIFLSYPPNSPSEEVAANYSSGNTRFPAGPARQPPIESNLFVPSGLSHLLISAPEHIGKASFRSP